MVLATFESSKINTMESPLQHDEIRPIQAANELSFDKSSNCPNKTSLVREQSFFVIGISNYYVIIGR